MSHKTLFCIVSNAFAGPNIWSCLPELRNKNQICEDCRNVNWDKDHLGLTDPGNAMTNI